MKRFGVLCAVLAVSLTVEALSEGESREVKVGVSLPLSGPLTSYGKSTLEGIRMHFEELNAAGGTGGRDVKVLVEDNTGDATAGINAYNKMAASDGCVCIIGPITSTVALAVRRAALKAKVPVVSPTATNDKVTKRNEYMFRACFNDSFQGRIIANYVAQGAKSAAVMMDMNSDYSKGLGASFVEAFTARGGTVAAQEKYQQKDTEFGVQLKKIKDSGAEIVFVPGYPPEVQLIIKQAKAIGLKARLCGADGWDNDDVINGSGDNVDGCLLVGAFSPEDQRDVVQKFIAAFQKRAGKVPGTFEALGYDSAGLVIEALRRGVTAEDVRKGLAGIKGLECVTGKITIDSEGDAVKNAVILKIVKSGEKYAAKYVATVEP